MGIYLDNLFIYSSLLLFVVQWETNQIIILLFCVTTVGFGRQLGHGFFFRSEYTYGMGKSESLLKVAVKLKNPGSDIIRLS